MGNEMKLVKFESLMGDINEKVEGPLGSMLYANDIKLYNGKPLITMGGLKAMLGNKTPISEEIIDCSEKVMALIYDFDRLNNYGKIILNEFNIFKVRVLDHRFGDLKDNKIKIEEAKKFIEFCNNKENGFFSIRAKYGFIFLALMILTVDETNKEEGLSLICDFTRLFGVIDDEVMDIVHIIKILYDEKDEEYKFKTDVPKKYFRGLLEYKGVKIENILY